MCYLLLFHFLSTLKMEMQCSVIHLLFSVFKSKLLSDKELISVQKNNTFMNSYFYIFEPPDTVLRVHSIATFFLFTFISSLFEVQM